MATDLTVDRALERVRGCCILRTKDMAAWRVLKRELERLQKQAADCSLCTPRGYHDVRELYFPEEGKADADE